MIYNIGGIVKKYTGDYQLKGVIVSVFRALVGRVCYVVQHGPGFLHIYSGGNMRLLEQSK